MNILELDSFRLSDAVKFHNRLNPKIWGADEHLLPEVREKLLEIAADFQEFLGVSDLDVEDITISGSNAAYSYTPHSDIDLHLVVNVPQDEVYQELFNAKKYQYNDMHDIRIRGADVELYVQPADQSPVSLGEYSIKNNAWLEVPKRKRARIDQTLVRHKYEDVKARIESALKEDDADRVASLIAKIKAMRQAGLDEHGEFGPENLAFKMLRKQGWIKRLYDHSAAARDRELSLKETEPKKPVKYGYGTSGSDYRALFKPAEPKEPAANTDVQFNRPQDYEWFKRQQAKKRELAAEDAGETWDGVNPTTCMFLNEEEHSEQIVHEFIEWAADRLGIEHMPEVFVHADPQWSVDEHSFGRYEPQSHVLHVNMANRHLFDVLRTTAHELAHCKQNEVESLPDHAGATGSQWENDAHAAAGIIMREFADAHPELFDTPSISESASGYIPTKKQARDPRYAMALTVDIRPGQVGKEANKMGLKTDSQGKPGLLMKTANMIGESKINDLNDPPGPEFRPTMPRGTVRVDVSDVYDWYKLGKNIANLDRAKSSDFGKGPPSTIVSFGDEETEHKYIKNLKKLGLSTTDIDPKDPNQPASMPRQSTDPTYNVDEDELVESMREEFSLLENEFISEIKMSPSNLRQEAAKTGAQAGMEFEMIVPGAGSVDSDDQEPDMDQDERARSIRDIREFFYDGDYNGRRDVDRLEQSLLDAYLDSDFLSERKREAWEEVAEEAISDLVARDYEDDFQEQAREEVLAQTDEFGTNAEELEAAVRDRARELMAEKVDEILSNMGREYDEAYEEWQDNDWQDLVMDWESDWLENEGIETMWDVSQNYDISWPYWTSAEEELDIDAIAEDFGNAVGKPVNASRSYHGARREAGHYVVEPDGSLEGDDSDDAGLEFVSPPMPIDELIADLNKVKKWADRENCYTNDSTGLHINVSVPNFSRENLDYIKLALLMGDQYVLDQFGRAGNTYTKAAIGKIRDKIRQQPERAQEFLDKMRNGMGQLASKAIHSGTTDKYTSINTKDGYIEFRSPGGDWLNENFDKIENTLLRFTVALSAAVNPQAYRQEYLKKLYKLLEVKSSDDPLSYFAKYAAGELPRAALKSFVKQAQLQRKIEKDPTGGQQYWWRVEKEGRGAANGAIIEVVATTKQEALQKAADEWDIRLGALTKADAYPVRPYTAAPAGSELERIERDAGVGQQTGRYTYRVFTTDTNQTLGTFQSDGIQGSGGAMLSFRNYLRSIGRDSAEGVNYEELGRQQQPNTGAMTLGGRPSNPDGNWVIIGNRRPVYRFMAANREDAETVWLQWSSEHRGRDWELQPAAQQPAAQQRSDEPQEWEMFNMQTGEVLGTFAANGYRAAEQHIQQTITAAGGDPDQYDARPVRSQSAQQPAPPTGAGREFAGWRVLMPTGEEVYRFSGVGNSQSDANRIAAEWLRNNGRGVSGEGFEVVPLWREA